VVGGGRADPLAPEGAGVDEVVVSVELGLVVALALGSVVALPGLEVVAAALAPALPAALLEASAGWPAHQSFFARCDGEAFRYASSWA
jgi:hypothetical protein